MFLYSGGHVNDNEKSPLQTAKRKIIEETGLNRFKQLKLSENEQIPIYIDTHLIEYNERLNLPAQPILKKILFYWHYESILFSIQSIHF